MLFSRHVCQTNCGEEWNRNLQLSPRKQKLDAFFLSERLKFNNLAIEIYNHACEAANLARIEEHNENSSLFEALIDGDWKVCSKMITSENANTLLNFVDVRFCFFVHLY